MQPTITSAEENWYKLIENIVLFTETHISVLVDDVQNVSLTHSRNRQSRYTCPSKEVLRGLFILRVIFEHFRHLEQNTSDGSIVT